MVIIANTRRSFVTALFGMGLLGAGSLLTPARAGLAPGLRLPDRPLRLTRVLERGLDPDKAAAITVRRWWEVNFERQARGIIASGRQLGAEVDAPPTLAALAQIERQRDASGMFPLMLSDSGTILTPPAAAEQSDAVVAALKAAEDIIARQPVPAKERARISHYLGEMHRAGSGLLATLPGDLLFPSGAPVRRSETVALPEGLTGTFTLSYTALPQADAPWLARAERRVTTAIGESRQQATEVWTMEPL